MWNRRTYVANQDKKHRMVDFSTVLSVSTSLLLNKLDKFTSKYGGARCDGVPLRLQCNKVIKEFEKSKSFRKCIKRYIIYNTPQAFTMKSFLSIVFRIYLEVN